MLQQRLTTGDVIHKCLCFWEPRLVALEEKADSIERHTGFLVCPRIMRVDVEEQSVDAQGEISVEQGFDHRWCLIPHAAQLRKALGLNNVLAIDMTSADGVEHVVGFVVSGRVKPELTHGLVDVLIMFHAIRNHRGGNALAGQLYAVLLGFLLDSHKEHLVDEFVDGLANIPERLVASRHGNASIDGKKRQQVIAATTLELLQEVAAPVLRAALP